ncbi:hypothetical protein [Anaerocolumna sp. MB42-C2]|uniref:hypothetical protein n=1 Tax=Anaerocolumna sp. MB42-C2 TaxID=3070997 RepID=UPI0027E0F5F5|nr:hypothetical protein [Anaerocolumna sp. MB42-C2]WMJ85571.1 hypothetical protein RBU59_16035 [Anaerocolumna sp. MB42-C2]
MNKNCKKTIIMLLSVILCFTCFPMDIYAATDDILSPQASKYIRSTSVNIFPESDGKLLLENKIGATRIVDKLGIITLEIQAKKNGYWQSVDVLVTDDYLYDTGTYIYDTYYYGTTGTQYRIYVEFYVENDGGYEIKAVTSTPKTAE